MARDFETLYYEQQASFTESNGMLHQENEGLRKKLEAANAALADVTSRADDLRENLAELAYRPHFDGGYDHEDGEPRLAGWECLICGALEPKLSTFEHLDECPLCTSPEAPK